MPLSVLMISQPFSPFCSASLKKPREVFSTIPENHHQIKKEDFYGAIDKFFLQTAFQTFLIPETSGFQNCRA
jgi:hypothetical protein